MIRFKLTSQSWAKQLLVVLLTVCFFSACNNDDVQSTYSTHQAYFYYPRVLTTQPLYAALTGPGQYCAISLSASNLIFQSTTNSLSVPITAVSGYQRFQCINGFIVGQSNIPDMTTMALPILAFDRACPNCYVNDVITRPLTLKENGRAYCDRCRRTYDLNNLGLIIDGAKGDLNLFRYHISYNGENIMVIKNQ